MEAKKIALLRILELLYRNTDEDHRMKQSEIITSLAKDYDISVERKVIGRDISLLREAGFDIVSSRKGYYINERKFTDPELRILIDGVLSSKYISSRYSKDLIEKLCSLSNEFFRSHVKHISSIEEWDKTDNKSVFYSIEVIDDAIEKRRQVQFDYNKYGTDKKLHKTSSHKVSPYQLILHNQRYYLMGRSEKYGDIGFFRLDHITDIELLDEVIIDIKENKNYKSGINYRRISNSMPYMFSDEPETVQFIADSNLIDQIIDWFGKGIRVEETEDENKIKVFVTVSPMAMTHWALQYAGYVRVVSPEKLVGDIKERLKTASQEYGN